MVAARSCLFSETSGMCAWFAFHEYGMGSISHFLYLVEIFVLMV